MFKSNAMWQLLTAAAVLTACDADRTNPHGETATPGTTAADTPDDTAAQQDQQEILRTIETMTSAFNRGDIDTVMGTYEDPATVVFQPGAPAMTREQLRAGFEEFAAAKPNFRFSSHEVYISGDIAVHLTPWTMTATAPGGTTMTDQGLSVAVLRRQDDGDWLMAIDNPFGQFLLDRSDDADNAPKTADAEEVEREILATIDTMTASFAAGDVDGVMSTYAPRATVLFEPGIATRGTDAIRAAFEQSVQAKPTFEFSGHEVYVAGDLAVHNNPWSMTATAPDGTTIEQSGLSVAVLQRQDDGRWLMAIDNPHGQRLLESPGYPE